jgi:hypothetical protein
MKQPANPFQRSLQKLKHQLSNGLNRAAKITPVHDRTDIPPRGCPAKIHPPIMSNLIHIPLKITATPNLLWRSPATKHTKQLPFTVDRYKTITVKTSFPGGSPPVPPTNFNGKKLSREQLPGREHSCPPSPAPCRVHERVVRNIDKDGFSRESLAKLSPCRVPKRTFWVKFTATCSSNQTKTCS